MINEGSVLQISGKHSINSKKEGVSERGDKSKKREVRKNNNTMVLESGGFC
jgi:hypothetical protein